MYENLVPIVVALIGVFQVALAIYFGRRMNEATANKEEAIATESIGKTYSALVQRLEERLGKVEANYEELCERYEKDKKAWEEERSRLISEIKRLEEMINGSGGK